MGEAISELLPLAAAVLVSPPQIIAVILLLLSARARANGLAFVAGWLAGLLLAGGMALFVAGAGGVALRGGAPALGAIIKLLLGLALLALGIRKWRGRSPPGEAELPRWMQSIHTFSPGKALGMALLLSAGNPKNLMLVVAAAVAISQADLSVGATLALFAAFVVVSSLSVLIPVLYFLVGGAGAGQSLDRWKRWLEANSVAMMAVLLVVIGTVLAGKGLGGLVDRAALRVP